MARVFLFLIGLAAAAQSTLPPWTPGTLDIHQISTGRGNSAFFILPDGTTMLVDAGGAGDGIPQTDPHPDGSRRPGEWIARYIRRYLPAGADGIDFALITHFHVDHMGGIADVGSAIPIRTLFDRGWPNYDYPAPLKDPAVAKYREFLAAKVGHVEKFSVGSDSQIHLLHDASKYASFKIRNMIANGELWTGTSTRQLFPPVASLAAADLPSENMCSLGIRLEYGKFRYFTSGDLPGLRDPGFPPWHDLEAAIAQAVGRVDVHVVNQHGSMGEESEPYLAALQSKVLIIPSWGPSHPAPDVLKRIVNSRLPPAARLIFATQMREATRIVIGARADALAAPPGHIVVRVAPGGGEYTVYVLDNRDERGTILARRGPFPSSK